MSESWLSGIVNQMFSTFHVKFNTASTTMKRILLFTLFIAAVAVSVSMYLWWTRDTAPQGEYTMVPRHQIMNVNNHLYIPLRYVAT